MTTTLLTLLHSALTSTPASIASPDLPALYSLAKAHDLAHLAAAGLRCSGCFPDGELGQRFRREILLAVHGDETKTRELDALGRLLGGAGIPYIPLKGAVLRELYPEPWMRTRCDVDVLIHREDSVRACDLLRDAGYDVSWGNDHDFSVHTPGGVHVELHYTLHGDLEHIRPAALERVWDYAAPKAGCEYALSDAMLYFSFLAHTAKHVYGGGCGLRPLIDLWLLQNAPDADRPGRAALVEEGGLVVFEQRICALAEAWIGRAEEPADPVVRALGAFILDAGVYGTMENKAASTGVTARGFYLRRIFCGYHKLSQKYPQIEGKPWLVPAYQFVRWKDLLCSPAYVRSGIRYRNSIAEAEVTEGTGVRELMEAVGLANNHN